jgi:subtilisin-like proprotein convertase family protein
MKLNVYPVFFLFLFLGFSQQIAAQPCACTNCPVPITDNGTFDGELTVTVDGPNDLGQCPLEQVCFTITHTWIGDLSVSLTSPFGLNYLVMADANNGPNGCGNDADDIDVCIDIGTANPLTNNTEYICNGGTPCLVGNWTVPCGGVTDPFDGALQAPNCNLNDFNQPGHPANGTWILTVNDICGQDVGFLQTWSMTFACGTLACVTCEADGGTLNAPDVQGCQGDPALNLNITPNYNPGPPPNPAEYGYTFVLSQNGIITGFIDGPALSIQPPGTYEVCGLSYFLQDAGAYLTYLGSPYVILQNDLNMGTAGFCGDLSDDCFTATIGPPIGPTFIETTLCLGDCFVAPDGTECCTPGPCSYTLQSELGCDSTIFVNINFLFPDQTTVSETVCPDECVTIDGEDYCPPGVYILSLTNQQGCDSIVTLSVFPVPVQAVIADPGDITCTNPAVLLDGSFSIGDTFLWEDENGQTIGAQATVIVNEGGCYTLTVSNSLNGVTCSSMAIVCVNEDLNPPALPVISGPDFVCDGEIATYTIVDDPLATDYDWTIPGDATVVSGGDGTTIILVDWTGSAGGDICVAAINGCGPGPEACLTVATASSATEPVISGPTVICDGSLVSYTVPDDMLATGYDWSISCGLITSGQNSNSITVDWTGCPTGGDVCLIVQSDCGPTDQVCLTVQGGTLPDDPVLSGVETPCLSNVEIYCVVPDPNASSINWVVTGGTILSGQGTNCIEVEWTQLGTGDVCATAENGCGASGQVCLPIDVQDLPTPPTINAADLAFCVGDSGTFEAVPSDPATTSYEWSTTCGLILSGQGTNTVEVEFPASGICAVCVAAIDSCGTGPVVCIDNTVFEYPVADAGPDDAICGLSYPLAAVPNLGTGSWTGDGPGAFTFTDPAAPSTTADVDTYGSYSFIWTEDNNGCTDSDTLVIDFNPDPVLSGTIEEVCTIDGQNYTVSFTLSGGASPYTVSGNVTGTLTGDTFTSDLIASGTPYSFEVTDANGCGPLLVEGQETCDCVSDAGTMDLSLLEACEDETVTSLAPSDTFLDPDDTFEFILHEDNGTNGSTLGAIVDQNMTGTFGYLPGSMTYGATYYISYVVGNDTGTGVDLGDDCTDIAQGQPLIFYENPIADAGPDDAVCGLSIDLTASPSAGMGMWMQTSGPGTAVFSDPASAAPTVTVDQYGAYTFSWTEDNNSCISGDEVTINFNDDPLLDGVVTTTCDPVTLTYVVEFNILGGDLPYSFTGTAGGTLTLNSFASDAINSGDAYSFEITDANGCGPLLVEGTVTCPCETDAGTMAADLLEACEDETVTAAPPADAVLDGNDIVEFILHTESGDSIVQILDQNTTGTFGYLPATMTFGTTYFISYVVGNDDGNGMVDLDHICTDIAPGQPIVFYENPSPDAGADQALCGLSTTLSATPSVGAGQWIQLAGPGTASFSDAGDPDSTVTVDVYGIYDFAWTEDNNGCTAQDIVTIDFNDDPVLISVVEVCDLVDWTFVLEVEVSGGEPPYIITSIPGTWNGNIFTTDPLPNFTAYKFEITDVNACGPIVISGQTECVCPDQNAEMDDNLFGFCVDETAVVPEAVNVTPYPEDIVVYVLHNDPGPQLGTDIFGTNTVPEFDFVAPMQTGVTYYISAVIGNDIDMDGVVDVGDNCLVVTEGTPVVFNPLPDLSFAADATVCEGETAMLEVIVTGAGCVDVSYELSDMTTGTATCLETGDVIEIPVTTNSLTLTVLSVTDQNGCVSTDAVTVDITVNLNPTATLEPTASICNSTDSGNTTMLDFSSLVIGGDQSGTWENTDNIPISGSFPMVDFTGVNPGTYTFTYTTGSALPPCEEQSFSMQVTVEDCVCPSLELATPAPLCNDNGSLNLSSLEITPAAGNWSVTAIPAGSTNPATINGTILNAAGADPGVYTLTFALRRPLRLVVLRRTRSTLPFRKV